MLPPMNRGAQRLTELISERGAQKRLADSTGIDQGHLSRIARGEKLPGLPTRRILERDLGILMQWWDEPPLAKSSPHATGDAAKSA